MSNINRTRDRHGSDRNNAPAPSASSSFHSQIEQFVAQIRSTNEDAFLITSDFATTLLQTVRSLLPTNAKPIAIESPVLVCGDTHGQLDEVLEILAEFGSPDASQYLFLGDYVDRGRYGVETFLLLCALKCLHPTKVHILRGNHETHDQCDNSFQGECAAKFSNGWLWSEFVDVFNRLPLVAIVDNAVFCVHGGLSPRLVQLNDFSIFEKIRFPCAIPGYDDDHLITGLVVNDPFDVGGWSANIERGGTAQYFGPDVVNQFLVKHNFVAMLRGHEQCNGFVRGLGDRCITIFSAWNYETSEQNDGGVCEVLPNLEFKLFRRRWAHIDKKANEVCTKKQKLHSYYPGYTERRVEEDDHDYEQQLVEGEGEEEQEQEQEQEDHDDEGEGVNYEGEGVNDKIYVHRKAEVENSEVTRLFIDSIAADFLNALNSTNNLRVAHALSHMTKQKTFAEVAMQYPHDNDREKLRLGYLEYKVARCVQVVRLQLGIGDTNEKLASTHQRIWRMIKENKIESDAYDSLILDRPGDIEAITTFKNRLGCLGTLCSTNNAACCNLCFGDEKDFEGWMQTTGEDETLKHLAFEHTTRVQDDPIIRELKELLDLLPNESIVHLLFDRCCRLRMPQFEAPSKTPGQLGIALAALSASHLRGLIDGTVQRAMCHVVKQLLQRASREQNRSTRTTLLTQAAEWGSLVRSRTALKSAISGPMPVLYFNDDTKPKCALADLAAVLRLVMSTVDCVTAPVPEEVEFISSIVTPKALVWFSKRLLRTKSLSKVVEHSLDFTRAAAALSGKIVDSDEASSIEHCLIKIFLAIFRHKPQLLRWFAQNAARFNPTRVTLSPYLAGLLLQAKKEMETAKGSLVLDSVESLVLRSLSRWWISKSGDEHASNQNNIDDD
jgi:diadenosine tetraphosphatase ApaH/serine/threonine PP2A family protein phosphatase